MEGALRMKFFKPLSDTLFWIVHRKPAFYAAIYLINIVCFALIYAFVFPADFKDAIGLVASFYFSVVTVTTLGFGDITPKLTSTGLILAITSQVVSGVILVGLFLNSLSQKLSDHKDAQGLLAQEAERRSRVGSLMVLLQPVLNSNLRSIAETYKITSSAEQDTYEIRPKKLFTDAYFDQISMVDMYSTNTRYGDNRLLAEVLAEDNKNFKNALDGYITKFSFALPVDVLGRLSDLMGHTYLDYPNMALNLRQYALGEGHGVGPRFMAFEHGSKQMGVTISPLRSYHSLLLAVINDIEDYIQDQEVKVQIFLSNHVSPSVGSAIVRDSY
jgi:ribosomal protein S17E